MNYKKDRGQSIIEVLFAVGVVGIVVVAVAILVTSSLSVSRKTLNRSDAVRIAEGVLESLTILKENAPHTFWVDRRELNCSEGDYVCSYFYNDAPTGCPPLETCTEVEVTVGWFDGQDRQVVLTKFFFKN
jgi:hypothetical protein